MNNFPAIVDQLQKGTLLKKRVKIVLEYSEHYSSMVVFTTITSIVLYSNAIDVEIESKKIGGFDVDRLQFSWRQGEGKESFLMYENHLSQSIAELSIV